MSTCSRTICLLLHAVSVPGSVCVAVPECPAYQSSMVASSSEPPSPLCDPPLFLASELGLHSMLDFSQWFLCIFFSGKKIKFQHLAFINFCNIMVPIFASCLHLQTASSQCCVLQLLDRLRAQLQQKTAKQISRRRLAACLCVGERVLTMCGKSVSSVILLFVAVLMGTQWFLTWFPMRVS